MLFIGGGNKSTFGALQRVFGAVKRIKFKVTVVAGDDRKHICAICGIHKCDAGFPEWCASDGVHYSAGDFEFKVRGGSLIGGAGLCGERGTKALENECNG